MKKSRAEWIDAHGGMIAVWTIVIGCAGVAVACLNKWTYGRYIVGRTKS